MGKAGTDFLPVFPETILLLCTVAALIAGLYSQVRSARKTVNKLIYFGFITAFLSLFLIDVPRSGLYVGEHSFILDGYALFFKKLILPAAVVVLAFGSDWLSFKKYYRFEYGILVSFSVLGMMVTVSADDFLMQFLGLEMMNLPLVFLASYKRQGIRSTEAGMKYVIMSILSSGLYLFGVSVIYACLGTIDFSQIAAAEKEAILPALLWGVSFVSAGLFMRLGVVPFHAWLADVYEGAPSPVTALFGILVPLPVMAAMARIVLHPFGGLDYFWQPLLIVICAASVFAGAFGAMLQTNIKRLTAYTVISLNGFALAALIDQNASGLLFFLAVNAVLVAGVFGIMLSLRIGEELSEEIHVLTGQGRVKPMRGAFFSLIFLGLTGIPPFAGFWTRFILFEENIAIGFPVVAVLLMLGSLVLAYIYLKLIRQMYFSTARDELLPASAPCRTVILVSVIFSAVFIVFAEGLWQAASAAVMGG